MNKLAVNHFLARASTVSAAVLVLVLGTAVVFVLRKRTNRHSNLGAKIGFETTNLSNPESIYAADPADSWNQIFRLLLSRTVKVRLADDLTTKGPFVTIDDGRGGVRVNSAIVDRFEIGDRAIDPLYPSFFNNAGVRYVLVEPQCQQ